MRTGNTILHIAALLTFSLLFTVSCKKERLLDLTDGVVLNVNTDIIDTPVSISFVNSKPGGDIPGNIDLDILGDGAPDIYTVTGEQNFTIVQGLVNIGIDKDASPSATDPIEFSLMVNANGFLPAVKKVIITDDQSRQHLTVHMVEEDNLPDGVSLELKNIGVNNNGISMDQSHETPLTPGKAEQVEISLEQGTKVYDTNGETLTGTLKMRLVHFDNRATDSQNAMEGFIEAGPALDESGISMGNKTIEPLGLYMLDILRGTKEVKTLSKPIAVRMTINPETTHPVSGEQVQVGDELPIWSLNEGTMAWQLEGTTIVEDNNGQLEVNYEQNHLSVWVVGYPLATCTEGSTLKIRTSIPQDACDRFYYLELINDNTDRPVARKALTYSTLTNGTEIELVQAPADIPVRLRVYSGVRACEQDLLAESQPFEACGSDVDINFNHLNMNDWYPISVSVGGYCETAGPDFAIAPTGNVLYRPYNCDGKYGFLGSVVNGKGCTATLKKGAKYDFKVRYGRSVYEYIGLTMEDKEIVYTLANGDVVKIRIKGDQDSAVLFFEEIPIPEDYCDLIDG